MDNAVAHFSRRQLAHGRCPFVAPSSQTVNVWTHLIGFLLMTCILIGTMMVLSPHGVDRLDLIVDLQSQPVCEPMADGSANPLCTAAHGSAAPSNVVRAADDPLELLHQILGDHQDEMLIELLSRVQTHVPDMQQLTQTLKAKASEIQASLLQHIPEEVIKVTDETSLSFTDYLTRMESKLGEVKESVSELLTPEVKHRAQAASLRVQEEFLKLQSTLSDFSREYSPELLLFSSPRHLDLISVTQKVIDRFMDQSHFRGGFSLSPTLVARPGVKVRVRSPVEGMPHLGSGSVFAHGLDDIEDDLEQGEIGEESQRGKKLIDAHSHSHTTLDEDGLGKTTSTAIGYMSIEAHTSTKKPGQVQLQLHSYLPRYPLAIFLVTAMMCLFFSSAYHLLHAVSDIWARRFQALDYAGIVLLIAGSTHPLIYYGFYCSPRLKWTYISIVWLLALVVFAIVVLPSFRHVQFRGLKVGCFIGLGLAGMVPFMHFCIHLGEIHFTFYWLLAMGACYIGGAMIYLFQVPERWFPGYFDFFFSSHQLWHLSIFAAVLVHYFAVLHHFEWRMNRVCTPTMWS
jgi:channel protein (hemolysin III family)